MASQPLLASRPEARMGLFLVLMVLCCARTVKRLSSDISKWVVAPNPGKPVFYVTAHIRCCYSIPMMRILVGSGISSSRGG
jgi:hypothetical protein